MDLEDFSSNKNSWLISLYSIEFLWNYVSDYIFQRIPHISAFDYLIYCSSPNCMNKQTAFWIYWSRFEASFRNNDYDTSKSPALPIWDQLTSKTIGFWSATISTILPNFIHLSIHTSFWSQMFIIIVEDSQGRMTFIIIPFSI